MKHQDKIMGVYNLYKLGRLGIASGFDTSIRVIERTDVVIPNDYAEQVNRFSTTNGLLYEKLVQETENYYDKKPLRTEKEYAKFEEVKKTPDEVDSEMIIIKAPTFVERKPQKRPARPEPINPATGEVITDTISDLREVYLELAEKKALPMWGKVKLMEEITKLNS